MSARDSIRDRLRWSAAVLLAALIGCGGEDDAGGNSPAASAPRSSPVAAVELAPRDLSRQVELSAPVRPLRSIRIPGRISAALDAVAVEEGDRVTAGDLLARFDIAEQAAELARAEAREAHARRELSYMEQLRERDAVSRNDLEQARVELAVAEAERSLWQTRVEFGAVRAPDDGVISARYVEPGEAVTAGETLFELAVMERLLVTPEVSELDVVHLQVGQTAEVRLDALPDEVLTARIRRVFPVAAADSRLVPVEFELPANAVELGVRPGFLARVRLDVDRRPAVLAVPAAAIGEDAGERYVFVIEDEQLVQRRVEPGVTRRQWTEIRAGLEAGEVVLATNPIDMRPGARVRIVGWRG